MRVCKQIDFIRGEDLNDLQVKVNEALRNGAELVNVDIPNLIATIIVTVYVGEIEKTLLDELEDEFGRHTCSECPHFRESTDKRKKWHTCEKTGKDVRATSSCCETYYREEGARDLPENKGEDERVRPARRGRGGLAEGITASGVRQAERTEQVPTTGMRFPVSIPAHTNGRVIRGGARCLMR